MDKDIKEKLNNLLGDLLNVVAENMGKTEEKLKDAMEESCEIHIKKEQDGELELTVKGNRLALMVALAGAEKSILKQIECSPKEFEYMKTCVATEGADDIE